MITVESLTIGRVLTSINENLRKVLDMYKKVEKSKENTTEKVNNITPKYQSGGESAFQFVDNRPETIVQRKLPRMINKSLSVQKAAQLQVMTEKSSAQQLPIQKKENRTGLPDNLKMGIENLSGYSMDDVKVYRNSEKPAQLQALAYAQGTDIHLASGQEKHLPHEAWHVVQQKQGRVKPTMQMKGNMKVNDDSYLEKEADFMGEKALQPVIQSRYISAFSPFERKIFQLFTVHDSALNVGQGNYGHVNDTGDRTDLTGTNPEQDEKMMALNLVAHLMTRDLRTTQSSHSNGGLINVGPHIAVSVVSKTMFVAVNSRYNGDNRGPTDSQLVTAAENAVDKIKDISGVSTALSEADCRKRHALNWVSNVIRYQGFGARNLTTPNSWDRQISGAGSVHGEQRILGHLTTDRNEKLRLSERATKLSRGGRVGTEKRVIRIGGTLADCIDCHETHHGTVSGQTGSDQINIHNQDAHHLGGGFKSNDKLLEPRRTRVMSPGTSGGSWPNWRLQQGGNDEVQKDARGAGTAIPKLPGVASTQANMTFDANPLKIFLSTLGINVQ